MMQSVWGDQRSYENSTLTESVEQERRSKHLAVQIIRRGSDATGDG